MVNIMYYLFRCKNIMPSEYIAMGFGEKQVVQAFVEYEIEYNQKQLSDKNNSAFPVINI